MKRISALVGVFAVLALMVPGAALASSSSTCQAYAPQTCESVSSGTSGTSPGSTTVTTSSATSANSAGTLPFTGLDVVLLVAGGGALLSAGFVIRRLSRRLN
jgi:guanyl-specific ribonuclease Sa